MIKKEVELLTKDMGIILTDFEKLVELLYTCEPNQIASELENVLAYLNKRINGSDREIDLTEKSKVLLLNLIEVFKSVKSSTILILEKE